MTDYFALLNEPRRPWLDPEALKEKFLSLSANIHPDHVHHLGEADRAAAQQRYVELNAAYQCLRDTRSRLRHLLELERGAVPKEVQRIPAELMDFSMEVGRLCRQADALAAEAAGITSPLLKVQFFERGQECMEELRGLQQKIMARHESLLAELKGIDREWAGNPGAVNRPNQIVRLEELLHLFSYFERWIGQVQERLTRLIL